MKDYSKGFIVLNNNEVVQSNFYVNVYFIDFDKTIDYTKDN